MAIEAIDEAKTERLNILMKQAGGDDNGPELAEKLFGVARNEPRSARVWIALARLASKSNSPIASECCSTAAASAPTNSERIECARIYALLKDWGKVRSLNARAEALAVSNSERVDCFLLFEVLDDLTSMVRCAAAVEKHAISVKDWFYCCELWARCRDVNGQSRALLIIERAAQALQEWIYCFKSWESLGDRPGQLRCLERVEDLCILEWDLLDCLAARVRLSDCLGVRSCKRRYYKAYLQRIIPNAPQRDQDEIVNLAENSYIRDSSLEEHALSQVHKYAERYGPWFALMDKWKARQIGVRMKLTLRPEAPLFERYPRPVLATTAAIG